MFREKKRWGQDPDTVVRSKPPTFNKPLKWKEPAFVFTCSFSDFFIEEADPWRDDAWEIVKQTPHLTYQILTKRPERIPNRIPTPDARDNIWLGVSVENQRMAEIRIPQLIKWDVPVRFLSVEPMLGPVDLSPWINDIDWVICGGESGGPPHREMKIEWATDLRDQCIRAEIPFFLKQLGGSVMNKRGGDQAQLDGQLWTQMPNPQKVIV